MISKYPYYFQVLNFADTQIPALAQVFKRSASRPPISPTSRTSTAWSIMKSPRRSSRRAGIKIVAAKSFPLDQQDFTPLLKEAKASGADAFLGFLYPQNAFPATGQAMEVGYNPKAFYMTVGPCLAGYRDAFSAKGIDGVMGAGAWNVKTSADAKDFFDRYTKRWGHEPEGWGTLFYYSSLQFLGQAIEEAGTLNNTKIRDLMATKTYQTALGPFKFTKGHLPEPSGRGRPVAERNMADYRRGSQEDGQTGLSEAYVGAASSQEIARPGILLSRSGRPPRGSLRRPVKADGGLSFGGPSLCHPYL